MWPLELSRQLRSSAQITGFDISPGMFPAKEWLPPNVRLEVLDVLKESMVKEVVGKFDVVHVRAFACVVKNREGGGVDRLMERIGSMLSKFRGCSSWAFREVTPHYLWIISCQGHEPMYPNFLLTFLIQLVVFIHEALSTAIPLYRYCIF